MNGGYSSIKALAEQAQALVRIDKVPPSKIIVLARLYAQLDALEGEFLARGIPYRVQGQQPFFKRSEINVLLNYLHLALAFTQPVDEKSAKWLFSVANKPSRMLSRSTLKRVIADSRKRKLSTEQMLLEAESGRIADLNRWQSEQFSRLLFFLEELIEKLNDTDLSAGDLLSWMVEELDYLSYFQDYYGEGEHSDEKMQAVQNFIRYISLIPIKPRELFEHLAHLDTTQGRPEEELIVFTTIFRTKGLEYDYVVIPQCNEKVMPYIRHQTSEIYDTQGLIQENAVSSLIDRERRLFYVALTRARRGVLIGTSDTPSRFLEEIHLPETEAVMGALAWLAGGEPNAREELLEALQNGGAQPDILKSLTDGYLPDLGLTDLAAQIQRSWTLPVPAAQMQKVT